MRIFTLFLLLSTWLLAQTESPLITQISSTHLIEGEVATFDLIFRDNTPDTPPAADLSAGGLMIGDQRDGYQNINGDRYYIYQYSVAAQTAGKYTIPELSFESNGKQFSSLPVELTVVPLSALHKERFDYKGEEVVCYSQLFFKKSTLYPSEATEVEYKIYVPRGLNTQSWGHPKPEKNFNCTAWRFEGPSRASQIKTVVIDNSYYETATYTTTLSAHKAGDASFGPLETILTISPGQMSSLYGYSRRNQLEVPITTPAPPLTVLPYPAGMPASFDGAVGSFTLEASFNTETSIQLSDSITATVTLSGHGNLDELKAPRLEDGAFWEIIDVSRVQQGEERKQLRGTTQFTYILQPKRGATALPRFTFSHFDPTTKKFYTDTTETSAIEVTENPTASTVILPDSVKQTENMQDILAPLAVIELSGPSENWFSQLPIWAWNIIPAGLLLLILLTALCRKLRQKSAQVTDTKLKKQALKELAASSDGNFLKLAAAYAEQWLPDTPTAQSILQQRDSHCYQPTNSAAVDTRQRKQLLKKLKQLSMLLMLAFLSVTSNLQAAEEFDGFTAWKNGDHQAALEHYLEQSKAHPKSADLLYNIGSCYYKLSQPGNAALYFQRALQLAPKHIEAQKNLAFVQQQQAAIQPAELSKTLQWINQFPPAIFVQLSIAGLWFFLLSFVALKLFKPRRGRYASCLTLALLGPLLAATCLYAYLEHPQRKLSSEGAAGVITEFSALLTEPIDVSGKELEKKTLINATPSSDCHILATRDQWSYVQLANGTRGWMPTNKVSAL